MPQMGTAAASHRTSVSTRLAYVRTPTPPDFTPRDFDAVFADLARMQVGAFVMDSSALATNNRPRLSELAIQHRLPSIWGAASFKDAALMVYGANVLDVWRRTAVHVDKILKGAKPAELPVELPTTFDFVINLKIAQALGLTIPESVLQQTTEVIQ